MFKIKLVNIKISPVTCRLCLKNVEQGKSLFDKLTDVQKVCAKHKTFADEYKDVTNETVEKGDGLPELICKECIALMHQAYAFKRRITVSQKILEMVIPSKSQEGDNAIATPQVTVSTMPVPSNSLEAQHQRLVDINSKLKQALDPTAPRLNSAGRQKTDPYTYTKKFYTQAEREVEEEMGRLFVCPYKDCNRFFTSQAVLYHHRKQKHRANAKKLCTVCGICVLDLEKHLLTHSNLRPFKCNVCGKGFKVKNNLRQHKHIHSETVNNVCSYCGKTFTYRPNLLTHERKHHEKADDEWACEVCNTTFDTKALLKAHMKVHATTE